GLEQGDRRVRKTRDAEVLLQVDRRRRAACIQRLVRDLRGPRGRLGVNSSSRYEKTEQKKAETGHAKERPALAFNCAMGQRKQPVGTAPPSVVPTHKLQMPNLQTPKKLQYSIRLVLVARARFSGFEPFAVVWEFIWDLARLAFGISRRHGNSYTSTNASPVVLPTPDTIAE